MTSSLSDVTKRRARAFEQAKARPRKLRAVSDAADTTAVMYLYGPISAWAWSDEAVTAKNVIRALKDIDADQIDVHLNSPGGDAIEGIAIMNALSNHPARVVIHVDALAASAASYIAQAGDEIVMGRGSQLMIHDASMICWGNAQQLHDDADWLDKQSQNIASIYADRAGGTANQWRELMRAETWYTAAEAVTAGLADRVAGKDEQVDPDADTTVPGGTPATEDSWDLSVFTYAGRQNAPSPAMPATPAASAGMTTVRNTTGRPEPVHMLPGASASGSTPPAAPAPGETTQEGAAEVFTEEQLTNLRHSLGLPEDADAGTIIDAFHKALAEQADDAPAASTVTVPAGMVLMDSATVESLRDDATAGREARNQQQADRRTQVVQTAINTGRIPPSRREHWENQLAHDPGAEGVLAGLEAGLIPLDEVGHGNPDGPNATDTKDDALYNQLFGAGAGEQKED